LRIHGLESLAEPAWSREIGVHCSMEFMDSMSLATLLEAHVIVSLLPHQT
jgi:hypothetical protein